MSRLIILQGAPAAGKSTWAREFVKGKKDWVIVNRDSIRDGVEIIGFLNRKDISLILKNTILQELLKEVLM